MFIIAFRKVFISLALALAFAALVALGVFGLKPSIDFTGGTLIEVSAETADRDAIAQAVTGVVEAAPSIRPTDDGFIVRTPELAPEQLTVVENNIEALEEGAQVLRVSTVGPTLGNELLRKALIALLLVALGIITFVAIAFWRVSKPVSSWVYGLVTLATLLFDVLMPIGVFVLLGYVLNVEVGALFVVALLTVLGYSVNDTIVVMDRIRENLRRNQEAEKEEAFESVVGRSLTQTYARSINTSLTTILVLLALFFFGGSQTEDFALALLVGVAAGAYSSIFFAAPLLVMISNMGKKKDT